MPDVVIENPILNSPYKEPFQHFCFGNEGITNEILDERRVCSYFVPIPPTKKTSKQLALNEEWTEDRIDESQFINRVRGQIAIWHHGGFGRWPYLEDFDRWNAQSAIRGVLAPREVR